MGALFSLGSPWATGNAITVSITNAGSGYSTETEVPTVNIEHRELNPLTNIYIDIDSVDGQGAITSVTIINGGLFYNVGDVVTVNSNTYTEPAELTVTSVEP